MPLEKQTERPKQIDAQNVKKVEKCGKLLDIAV